MKLIRKCVIFAIVIVISLFPLQNFAASSETIYTPAYSEAQGTNNWQLCEFCGTESYELTLDNNKAYWRYGNNYFPYIRTSDKIICPAKDSDTGFIFTAPATGMVRIKGEIECLTSLNSVVVKIHKDMTDIWSGEISYGKPADYDVTIPVEKGEKLYFKVCADYKYAANNILWIPTVEYVDTAYTPDTWYSYLQEHNGKYTALKFDQNTDKYYASDKSSFISQNAVRAMPGYSIIKRHAAAEPGRYRIYGDFAPVAADMEVNVLKNGTVIWKQLMPAGEPSVLDVRALLDAGDVIDIELSAVSTIAPVCTFNALYIGEYLTAPFVKASTSTGDNYTVISQTSLSDLIANNENVSFYSKRYSRELPMTKSNAKWVSSVTGDQGYISANSVFPGDKYDSVMEVTVSESGILHIDGDLRVRENSDGVLSKILLNDEVVWSSRVGEEAPVRWDDPYDTSYFSDNVSVTLKVKKGDKLCFSFNKWRLTNNDTVDISNVKLKYIEGELLSDTTKWKMEKSTVIDTEKRTVTKDGNKHDADIIINNGAAYISSDDAAYAFGGSITAPLTTINNKQYLPVRANAEQNGDTVVWAAERLIIIYSGIPVFYCWNELSEISAFYAESETKSVNKLNDTYEADTVPLVSLSGGNSTKDNVGGLKPQFGHTEIAEQSNALVLDYFGHKSLLSNTSEIDISNYTCDRINIIEADIFIPAAASFKFGFCGSGREDNAQVIISENGWVSPCYGNDDIGGGVDLTFEEKKADSKYSAAEFSFGTWNNIKLVSNGNDMSYCLYLNNTRVGGILNAPSDYDVSMFKIVNYSAAEGKEAPLYIDNFKLRTGNNFTAAANITEQDFKSLTTAFNDTFEDGDSTSALLSWKGGNQLRPFGGTAGIVKQSNAARVFSGKDGANTEHIRFDIRDYANDSNMAIIVDFDINVFKNDTLLLSERYYFGHGGQAVISPKGYIASAYGLWSDTEDQQNYIRNFAGRDMENHAAAPFKKNRWHNIKMLYEAGGTRCSLYLDGKLVNVQNIAEGKAFDAFQFSIMTDGNNKAGDAIFDIDNLKISEVSAFDISDVYFESKSGKRVESFIPGEDYCISFHALNNSAAEKDANILVAQYDGKNKLIGISVNKKVNISKNGGIVNIGSDSPENTVTFKSDKNAERLTIYVFDDMLNIIPLAEAVSIYSAGDSVLSVFVDYNNNTVHATGNTGCPGEYVSAVVTKPGDKLSTAAREEGFSYIDQVTTDENGQYELTFTVPDIEGEFNYYMNAWSVGSIKTRSFKFKNQIPSLLVTKENGETVSSLNDVKEGDTVIFTVSGTENAEPGAVQIMQYSGDVLQSVSEFELSDGASGTAAVLGGVDAIKVIYREYDSEQPLMSIYTIN